MADEAGIGPPAGLLHLPAGFPADTADAFAVVGGARLELHSQVLATQANVLRDVFVTRLEGGAREEGPADLSLLFEGHPPAAVSLLLRWLYQPQLATRAELEGARANLEAVLRLAHKLGASGAMQKLAQWREETAASASAGELLHWASLGEGFSLGPMRTRCLAALADKLRAEGAAYSALPAARELAGCGEDEVLGALEALLSDDQPAEVLEINSGPEAGGTGTFGFTWALSCFSDRVDEVASPWVALGGQEWRLTAYPQGLNNGVGTHLAAFLWCNMVGGDRPPVLVNAAMTLVDQTATTPEHFKGQLVTNGLYTAENEHWGRTLLAPLSELRRGDRRYLEQDRLLLRVEINARDPAGPPAIPPVPSFDPERPELFYLPDFFNAEPLLSDASLALAGYELPLHSQVLMLRVGACLAAAGARGAGAAGEGGSDAVAARQGRVAVALARCCTGHALRDVAAFLRLAYSPHLAELHLLQPLAPQLPALLRLAHASGTRWLLQELAAFMEARLAQVHTRQLWNWAAAAATCELGDTSTRCLAVLGRQLMALGPSWEAALPRGLLASDVSLAVRLLGGVLAACRPEASLRCVRDGDSAGGSGNDGGSPGFSTVGGFCWAVAALPSLEGEAVSPWVGMAGHQWQLVVTKSVGTHLAIYLRRRYEPPEEGPEVPAKVEFRVFDQGSPPMHHQRTQSRYDRFSPANFSWGQMRFMTLEELQRPDRQYLRGGRLEVGVELRVAPAATAGAPAAVAAGPAAEAPAAAAAAPVAEAPAAEGAGGQAHPG